MEPFIKNVNVPGRNDSSIFGANARVYIVLDGLQPFTDSKLYGPKKVFQITKFIKIDSTISVHGGNASNASVTLNDKDFKFTKYVPVNFAYTSFFSGDAEFTKTRTNEEELKIFENILETYGDKGDDYFKELALLIRSKGFLVPALTPMNLIFIQYLGRDGYWYSGFTGLITSITTSGERRNTPTLRISAKTPERFFELSYIVTGQKNLSNLDQASQESLQSQDATLPFTNKYGNKKASTVLVDVVKTVNNFFLGDNIKTPGVDYRYFKVKSIFGLPTDGQEGYEVDAVDDRQKFLERSKGRFENKRYHFDDRLDSLDLYPGVESLSAIEKGITEEKDWLEVAFTKDFYNEVTPFQNVVRGNLQLFQIDKQTPKQILDSIRRATFAYIYCDADGTLKMERPYFDTFVGNPKQGIEISKAPIDYDYRYIISTKDRSYLSHSFNHDEVPYVTRTTIQQKRNLIQLSSDVETYFQGKSESSKKTISKYGDREMILDSIISSGFAQSSKVASAYAKAAKTMINAAAKTFNITLDQRPDLQVNRNMIFLDFNMCFVIESINTSYSPKGPMTHNIKGAYTRFVGERIINPWRSFIDDKGSESSWAVEVHDFGKTEGFQIERGSDSKKGFFDIYSPAYDDVKTLYGESGVIGGLIYKSNNITDNDIIFKTSPGDVNFIILRVFDTFPGEVDGHMNDYLFAVYLDSTGQKKVDKILCSAEPTKLSITKEKNLTVVARVSQGVYNFTLVQDTNNNSFLKTDDFYYQIGDISRSTPWSSSNTPVRSLDSSSKLKTITISANYSSKVSDDYDGLNEANVVIRNGINGEDFKKFEKLIKQHFANSNNVKIIIPVLDRSTVEGSLPKVYYLNDKTDDVSLFKRCLSTAETSLNSNYYIDSVPPSAVSPLAVFNKDTLPGSLDKEYDFRGKYGLKDTFGAFAFILPETVDAFAAGRTLEDLIVNQFTQNEVMNRYLKKIKEELLSIKDELLIILQANYNPTTGEVTSGGDVNNLAERKDTNGICFFGERVGWGSFVAIAHLSYKLMAGTSDKQRTIFVGGQSKVISPFLYLLYVYYQIGYSKKSNNVVNPGMENVISRDALQISGRYLYQYINLFSNFGWNSNNFINSL